MKIVSWKIEWCICDILNYVLIQILNILRFSYGIFIRITMFFLRHNGRTYQQTSINDAVCGAPQEDICFLGDSYETVIWFYLFCITLSPITLLPYNYRLRNAYWLLLFQHTINMTLLLFETYINNVEKDIRNGKFKNKTKSFVLFEQKYWWRTQKKNGCR